MGFISQFNASDNKRAIFPLAFGGEKTSTLINTYLSDQTTRRLIQFFEAKGLAAIKDEDRREVWYADWLAYQNEHRLYAMLLSPKEFSSCGGEFNVLRLARFLEVFGYFSPAHGYSLQCTFLGLFPILMGSNSALKKEAVALLEAGEIFALGVSEKQHGADLISNEFTVRESTPGRFVVNGSKYYIGNCNAAAIVSVLGKKVDARSALRQGAGQAERARRMPMMMFALRGKQSNAMQNVRKIQTIGVRAAFVGEFEVKDYEMPASDVFAEGRDAWEAVLGTVTLGKFFLGFGSIGICEHAFKEALDHLTARVLYGKSVLAMPHIRSLVAQAHARLTAMKLYAYRALDYVQAATAEDRRYLLFNAVQKAKTSTEGVKTVSTLLECIGAKGFEADTFFEMALRDVPLIPSLEGSAHINLSLASQFIPAYFSGVKREAPSPGSLFAGTAIATENAYLMAASSGSLNRIEFSHFLEAYEPLIAIRNVRLFARQAKSFQIFITRHASDPPAPADTQSYIALGQCIAIIAYGQLIAENATILEVPRQIISAIFHLLIIDLNTVLASLVSLRQSRATDRILVRALTNLPETESADWDFVVPRATSAPEQAGS